jgi:competence protein ComEC
VAVAVVAQAGSWPLVAWHYNLFSVVAPLANPPVAVLTGALLLTGLAAAGLWHVPILGVLPLWPLLDIGLRLLRQLVLWFAALPGAAVSLAPPPPEAIVAYFILLWGAAALANRYVIRKTLFAPGPAPAASGGGALAGVAVLRP